MPLCNPVAHSSFSSVELLGSNTRNFSQVTFTVYCVAYAEVVEISVLFH